MAKRTTVPVTMRALIQRINLKLSLRNHRLGWITLFSARSFLRLVPSPPSALQAQGPGADMHPEDKKEMVVRMAALGALRTRRNNLQSARRGVALRSSSA